MSAVTINWQTQCPTGTNIRKLNAGNLAPNISGEEVRGSIRNSFKELNLAYSRLHDAPLTNPGCRLVDISHIFPLFHLDENDPRNYDFSYTDDYITACIVDSETPVYYRLGESIDHSLRKYKVHPPENTAKWINICSNIIRHYTEGLWNGFHYRIQYWEIWNEPDAWMKKMWTGTLEEFNCFYVEAAKELKKRFPHLKIGGPSHVKFRESSKEFIRFCAENRAPLDFYSFHCYSEEPYEKLQMVPYEVRKFLDENGYTDTEVHLTEWHYFPGHWARLRSDADYKAYAQEEEMKKLDSAAYLTTVMMLWQDSPLDYGAYYTCDSGNWGCYRAGSNLRTPSWYGLKAFGELVRYPVRLKTESSLREVTVLSGMNEAGEKMLLVSAFKTGVLEVEISADIPLTGENCQIRLLDHDHLLSPAEEVFFDGNTVKFQTNSYSSCALIKLT